MNFWDAAGSLPLGLMVLFALALIIAFAFEFINGFHDTANAVTTVIYTRSMKPSHAVLFSGVMNFLGVLLGGTAVAFGIVNLLPVDLLVNSAPGEALVAVMALLIAGVVWNLGTWYFGLPVSSSHTLIGSILGVGIASGVINGRGSAGVRWDKAAETGLALLFSPVVGFLLAGALLLFLKTIFRNPKLYTPPEGDDKPPTWIRNVLWATCGGVSFAHGSNDGQKGMGLLLLVLIGFLPFHYALNPKPELTKQVYETALKVQQRLPEDEKTNKTVAELKTVTEMLEGKEHFVDVPEDKRWTLRTNLYKLSKDKNLSEEERNVLVKSVEYVPLWVIIGTAIALGVGTTVGYKRIVITVAERIGKTHLTYAQGAAAETIAAITVLCATLFKLPVSTTHVLSSGVAGTMVANKSGIQGATVRKIALAWLLTLPVTMVLGGGIYAIGKLFV